ncbi:MAG: cation transporter [bacterium]|nr:cation transporter [bacterium]
MDNTKTFRIKGMHCASCATIIEKTFKKTDGVDFAEVNYGTETTKLKFDSNKIDIKELSKKIEPLGYSIAMNDNSEEKSAMDMDMSAEEHAEHTGINQSKKEKLEEISAMKRKIRIAIPMAVVSIILMAVDILIDFKYLNPLSNNLESVIKYLLPLMATYMIFAVGKPYLLGFYRFLRYGKANMDTLIGIGTSVAYVYSLAITFFEASLKNYINTDNSYFDVTIIVIAFIAL